MAENLINRQTTLSGNTVHLCRFLRKKGFNLSSREEADALQALSFIPFTSEKKYRSILRAILCKNQYQYTHFDEFYEDYLVEIKKAVDSKVKQQKSDSKDAQPTPQDSFENLKNWLYGKPTEEESEISAYSSIEVLTKKQFASMNEEEVKLILRVLEKLVKRIAHHKSRLRKRSKKYRQVDMRLTFRENLRQGNDIRKLVFSEKKNKKLRLILLCDVSKSMDLYSRFFVQMIYAFQNGYDKIETLVFSTALHRVTPLLDNNDFDQAFEMISDRVPQWSGGTKIGKCFAQFNEEFGHKMLDRKTIVLVLSDGWDTGEPEILKDAMRSIHKASRKVIWLNPLSGNPNFSPEVSGLKMAMPYIDRFCAAHNLESLKAVIRQL